MSGWARRLGAVVVLVAGVLGVPAGLVAVAVLAARAGVGVPDLTRPDDGSLVLAALYLLAWVAWALAVVPVAVEVAAVARGRRARPLPGLTGPQRIAAALVTAALAGAPVSVAAAAPVEVAAVHGPPRPAAVTQGSPAASAPTPFARAMAQDGAAAQPARAGTPAAPAPSAADTRAPSVAPSVAPSTATPPAAAPPAAPAVAAVPAAAAAPVLAVTDGDTLWRLAERHLGDGFRWRELAAANYGRAQPDGRALDASHVLHPGWVLALPGAAGAGAPPPVATSSVVVAAGDTLSEIAAERLGDPARYPELVTATAPIVQPDGRTLADPDLIYPGWTVAIPTVTTDQAPAGAAPAPAAPPGAADAEQPAGAAVDAEQPAGAAPSADAAAAPAPDDAAPPPDTAAPPPDTAPPGEEIAEGAAEGSAEEGTGEGALDDDAVRTAAGVGALLAAALLGLVALRRGRQRAHRRPGRRLPLPTAPATVLAEARLRQVADPAPSRALAAALADLAHTTRVAGGDLPRVRAARLSGGTVELYLAADADLPSPWQEVGDRSIWSRDLPPLPPDTDAAADPLAWKEAEPPAAPFPTLVTLGQDTPGSHLLVDLDELGVLRVRGEDREVAGCLSALAAELATAAWASDVLVTLVDPPDGLADALPTGRVRVLPLGRALVDLRARAAAVTRALEASGDTGLAAARHRDAQSGDWEYEVVVSLTPLPAAAEAEVVALARRGVGVSAVLAGPVPPQAGPGDALGTPTQVTPEEDAVWTLDHLAPADGDGDRRAVLRPVDVPLAPQSLGVDALHALLDVMAHTSRPAVAPAPWAPLPPPARALARPDGDHEVEVEVTGTGPGASGGGRDDEATPAPRLRLLGRVGVDDATGPAPGSHTARTMALLAVLAVHREGRTRDQLAEALSPNARLADTTLHALVSRARRWLGTAPDGRSYLPRVLEVDGAAASYRLDPAVTSDWDEWRERVGPDPTRAPLERLVEALSLVADRPFAGVVERHYAWAEPVREEMTASVVDVAHDVAQRALARRDLALARRAVAAGRRADPGAEVLWRDALEVEAAAGTRGSVAALVTHIQAWSDDTGLDLDPATEALVLRLGGDDRAPVGATRGDRGSR